MGARWARPRLLGRGRSGDVDLNLEVTTQATIEETLWVYRRDSRTLLAIDGPTFATAPETAVDDLRPAGTETSVPAPESSARVDAVTSAFNDFIDPSVSSAGLGLGAVGAVRDDLLELLDAQVQGAIELGSVDVDGDRATVRFDVVTGDGATLLPDVEFVFADTESGWRIQVESVCALAGSVGLACSPS